MNRFDFIDGWDIGADGKWKPRPCQSCGGDGVIERPINPNSPRERWWADRGSIWWCDPCLRCKSAWPDFSIPSPAREDGFP